MHNTTTPLFRFPLAALFLWTSAAPLFSQEKKNEKELRLNENAIKMIQFDFTRTKEENPVEKMVEAPLEKRWMKFKETVPFKRSFADTTTVKQIDGFVRAEPYTIWTQFGENPVYDVMPSVDKEWTISWKINPHGKQITEYGHTLKPSTGMGYDSATGSAGVGVALTVDYNKFLYEHLTAQGRAIRHNRKHANAWKTYADYVPTIADSVKMPNLWKRTIALQLRYKADTLSAQMAQAQPTDSIPLTKQKKNKKQREKEAEIERVTTIEEYIRQRASEDSARRKEFLRKDKERRNAYDTEHESRMLNERRN